MDELWLDPVDDPMPSCDRCHAGQHGECRDLIFTKPYGVHACGCRNSICNPEE